MAAVKRAYTVRARCWSGGWELHIPGAGVTQVSSLARAKDQVRDYLATLYAVDASGFDVTVVPEAG